jgi:hypothetical protein
MWKKMLLGFAFFILAPFAFAETVDIPIPCGHNHVTYLGYHNACDYGVVGTVGWYADTSGINEYVSWVKPDLSVIPQDKVITSATLEFTNQTTAGAAFTYNIYRGNSNINLYTNFGTFVPATDYTIIGNGDSSNSTTPLNAAELNTLRYFPNSGLYFRSVDSYAQTRFVWIYGATLHVTYETPTTPTPTIAPTPTPTPTPAGFGKTDITLSCGRGYDTEFQYSNLCDVNNISVFGWYGDSYGSREYVSWVKPDFSSVPSGKKITAASLEIMNGKISGPTFDFTVYRGNANVHVFDTYGTFMPPTDYIPVGTGNSGHFIDSLDPQEMTNLLNNQDGGLYFKSNTNSGLIWISSYTLHLTYADDTSTTITATPETATVTKGTPFTVDVVVDGGAKTFNAAQADVTVSDSLAVTGLQNPTNGGCNFQYTVTPSIQHPSFAGAILGGSSQRCTVYRLTLTPLTVGTGTVSFTKAQVKAVNPAGEEILDSTIPGFYTITDVSPTPTPPNLSFSAGSYPLDTYLSQITLHGTKSESITRITVGGLETGVTYPDSTHWDYTVTLQNVGAHAFIINGYSSEGQSLGSQTIAINLHNHGDINGDGQVNLMDASLFAVDWNKTSNFTYPLSDMNNDWHGDGTVDLTDFSILASLIE